MTIWSVFQNPVTYGVVLVTNYWLGTVNCVKLEKVACLSGDLDNIWGCSSVRSKSFCGLY